MSKMFQIYEHDLAALESEIPLLLDSCYSSCNDDITRKRWQLIKEALSNIRWNYGPPNKVETIDENQ